MKVWGRLGYCDHKMMEFQILKGNRAKSNIHNPGFKEKRCK